MLEDYNTVLTVKEVAEVLCICTATVYSLIDAGKLAAVKVGKNYRIPKYVVVNYLGN